MAGLGGRREGSGRKPGIPNKASGVVRAAAQVWGMPGIERLAQLAGLVPDCPTTEPGATQVAAIRELLDRGYGKALQPLSGEGGLPLPQLVVLFGSVEHTSPMQVTFDGEAADPPDC